MSSLLHSPKGGSTAAKLKGFGLALNKSFGIAKRWTLEKVGAKEPSQEPPEVAALVAAFHQDKADLEELRAKVAHLITTEKVLLDADLSFSQVLDDLHIPTLPTSSDDPDTSSTSSPSTAPSSSSSIADVTSAAPPPFTPQTFASFSSTLHTLHHTYLTQLGTALLDPLDQLLDNDVSILTTISKQLPLLRLDHMAKADALQGVEKGGGKGLEEAQKEEKESREVWEAQMEVVDKLAREVSVKKGEVIRQMALVYVQRTREWYEAMHVVTLQAIQPPRPEGGVEGLKMEYKTVGEKMEAMAEAAGHKMGEVGEKLIDTTIPDTK